MITKNRFYRFLEIIPGALIWGTLLGAVALSFAHPVAALYFIILFDLYWLFRVLYFVFYLAVSWRRLKRASATDWMEKLRTSGQDWERLWQVVFLPTYKEDVEVLRATLRGLVSVRYPLDRFIVVLAGEERDQEHFLRNVEQLRSEFGGRFSDFLVTVHPAELTGEIPGKGSNLNFAGRKVQEYLDTRGIPYADVIASAFDCDTIAHPQYFAALSYAYCTASDPLHTSFQPIPLYNNNIWEAPAFLRVAALSTTFWLMTELVREERLWTFSSHSMPFAALCDVGFWQKDVVNEDTRILLQCFLRYGGNYRVTPLYLPVSMDTVSAESYLKSHLALYRQQRRWAWGGAEHIPFLAWHFLRDSEIGLYQKARWLWTVGEGMHSWATAPLLIFVLGKLPFWFGGEALGSTVLFQYTPRILEWLMRLAMAGILISILLTHRLLPKPPPHSSILKRAGIYAQWVLLPFSLMLFSAAPAIDAQTRLMFGRYLGFNVTKKMRKTKRHPQMLEEGAPVTPLRI